MPAVTPQAFHRLIGIDQALAITGLGLSDREVVVNSTSTGWIVRRNKNNTLIAGIDHGFSFPIRYFRHYGFESWPDFLDDFCRHWPTGGDHMYVDFIRQQKGGPPDRTGEPDELRLTEQWTSSAKSVFKFDVQGSVAKSTHAGIPWLRRIRGAVGDRLHCWPLDGWHVPDSVSVIAEVYPSIFRNRYPREGRTADQQDAYAIVKWPVDIDKR